MTREQLRTILSAVVALAVIGVACNRNRVRHDHTTVVEPRLGESTASPGSDPDRPLAQPLDTHDVSAPISRLPAGPAPPPPAPTEQPPPDAGQPGVFSPPPPPEQ